MFTKFRLLAALVLTSVGGVIGYERVEWLRSQVEQAQPHFDKIVDLAHGILDKCSANPVPIWVAVAGFLFTMVYHWAKGKSFRESVEVAATRVKVVETTATPAAATVSPAYEKAQKQSVYLRLAESETEIEAKIGRLRTEVAKADKVMADTSKQAKEARLLFEQKTNSAHDAHEKYNLLLSSLTESLNERDSIKVEMRQLEKVV